jgi:3'(2'), 5'-bisphosphate nucleotidase
MTGGEEALVRALLDVARMASELVLEACAIGFEVFYKGPDDPVTSADHAANELICRELAKRFPDIPIVAEESDPGGYAGFEKAPRVFFVDPIDGTREFLAGSDEFAIMIGLAEGGRALAGVVLAPKKDTTWYGSVGTGAFRETSGRSRRIQPSTVENLSDATLLVSHPADDGRIDLATSMVAVGKVQSVGSAGLKGAMVADGSADVYLSPGRAGKRWDACAIDALLVASGGTLTDTNGEVLDYQTSILDNDDGLLATNGRLLRKALAQLRAQGSGIDPLVDG